MRTGIFKNLLRPEQVILLLSLLAMTATAWLYLIHLAHGIGNSGSDMGSMEISMPQMQSWVFVDFILMFVMWTVMMVAMMVPATAPMLLMYANVTRRRKQRGQSHVPTSIFLLGYILIWTGFSVLATFANWGLHINSMLSSMMGESTNPILGGVLLIAAGLFQWTSLKTACLSKCRSPLTFIMDEWRDDHVGVLYMGLKHGIYCLGCCWALMLLLFVLGVMNLSWIAGLSALVMLEKMAPKGIWMSRIIGIGLMCWGALILRSI